MKNTAIYIRVSSDKQAREGDSVAAQKAALREYIDKRPDLLYAGEYLDDGISGTKYSQRDELQKLLSDVENGKIDLIIFTKLDRWFRSVRHYTATQEILDRHQVPWTAIWEPIYDTSTPQGRLIVNQMMSIAQFEAENTGQRIRQVQAYKLTQKEVISGSTPPGLSISNRHLVPNHDACSVLTAFEIYSKTGNLNETMRMTAGLPGIPSSKSGIKRMLKNPLYIGMHSSGLTGFCSPIVPEDLFYDVQRKLSMNIRRSQKQTYIFSGLIRCAECGRAFGGNTRRRQRGNGNPEIIPQYRCSWHYNFKPPKCENRKVISETALEKQLINNLSEMMKGAIFQFEAESAPHKDLSSRINAIEQKISRLKDLYVNGLITIEEYKTDKESFISQISTLQKEQQKNTMPPAEAVDSLKALLNTDIKTIYTSLSKEEKRLFWRGILKAIMVDRNKKLTVEFLALSGNK